MRTRGERTSPLRIALAAPVAFSRSFILKGGFRDGIAGFCIARFAAHHAFLKHVLLWEMQQEEQAQKARNFLPREKATTPSAAAASQSSINDED